MWNKSQWSLGILAAAGAWAVVGSLAGAQRRKRAKKETAIELQEWENEGGAPALPTMPH
jgi:hypothetical protein